MKTYRSVNEEFKRLRPDLYMQEQINDLIARVKDLEQDAANAQAESRQLKQRITELEDTVFTLSNTHAVDPKGEWHHVKDVRITEDYDPVEGKPREYPEYGGRKP